LWLRAQRSEYGAEGEEVLELRVELQDVAGHVGREVPLFRWMYHQRAALSTTSGFIGLLAR
jgi:hypothetical protein